MGGCGISRLICRFFCKWRDVSLKKETRDILVASAALFAMFFGAGNLIFPPSLGFQAGENWLSCILGFALTGAGLPILGVIAMAKTGGSLEDFAGRVSPFFAKAMGTGIVLAIGPFLAIPRTGATVFEVGIQPLFPQVPPLLASIVFFTITLLFVLKPTGIVDKIGKILTPALLLIVSLIIVKGVLFPIGQTVSTPMQQPFSKGFIEGYQTMDALASILFAGLILSAIKNKGYQTEKDQIRLTCQAGMIAGVVLMAVYGGLLFLGATASDLFATDISKAKLIIAITHNVLGSAGQLGMCLAVSAACLTTAIGVTAVVGDYIATLTNGRIGYTPVVLVTTLFSTVISVSGVEKIVQFSVPLLIIAYPIVIVLIVLNLFARNLSHAIFRGAVFGTLLLSVPDALAFLSIDTGVVGRILKVLPFTDSGFSWILPSVFCAAFLEGIRLLRQVASRSPQAGS